MLRLCSDSSTRARLLRDAHIDFIQSGVDFDEESITAYSPKSFAYQATLGKYCAALDRFDFREIPLLLADTVVTAHGRILRKAKCIDDARNILMSQSGGEASIVTCMLYKSAKKELLDISVTRYRFRTFDPEDLERYLQSGEWRGKAGACMVEGFCKKYIESVHGFESTAMGLSIEILQRFADA